MPSTTWSWCKATLRRRPVVEQLEDRTLLDASPLQPVVPLNMPGLNQAHVANLASVNIGLPDITNGTIHHPNQVDTYSFTISSAEGEGNLTAEVAATSGTVIPRLTLSGPQ